MPAAGPVPRGTGRVMAAHALRTCLLAPARGACLWTIVAMALLIQVAAHRRSPSANVVTLMPVIVATGRIASMRTSGQVRLILTRPVRRTTWFLASWAGTVAAAIAATWIYLLASAVLSFAPAIATAQNCAAAAIAALVITTYLCAASAWLAPGLDLVSWLLLLALTQVARELAVGRHALGQIASVAADLTSAVPSHPTSLLGLVLHVASNVVVLLAIGVLAVVRAPAPGGR